MSIIKTIENLSEEKLCVETFTPANHTGTVVLCHGITGCRKGRTPADNYFQLLASKLEELNFKVVLFDYSGHGDSEGNDSDVCLSKSVSELEIIYRKEVDTDKPIHFLAFSYGAAVLCRFLENNPSIKPASMVLYSPCIFPNESCFLNADSIFGKDVVKSYNEGEMLEKGYAIVGAKGFKLGLKMLEECKTFSPAYLSNFRDKILVLSGRDDVILNTKYHTDFCGNNKITNIWLNASHSLYEDIDTAFSYTITHFEKNN